MTTPKSLKTQPPDTDKPVEESIGYRRAEGGGYLVFKIWTQGSKVLRRELIKGPEVKAIALAALAKAVEGMIRPKN